MSSSQKIESIQEKLKDVKKSLNSIKDSEDGSFSDREAYLSEFYRVCDRFDVEVELEEDMDKDEIYSEWDEHVNMSAGELRDWSQNPCSREASLDPEAVIKRNLRLLERNKDEWTENDYKDAERTISFISRMDSEAMTPDSPREGPHGCPSEWAISLLNWAYNPFDSVPKPSSEVKEDLDPVEEVTLSSELQEGRRNIKEAEMLAEQVWVMKDVLEEFNQEFQDLAMSLEEEKDIEEVRNKREQVVKSVDLMMSKLKSPVRTVKKNPVEELQASDFSYEFSPVPDQVLYEDREEAESRAEEIGLEGVHMHPVIFREPAEIPDGLMEDVTVYHMAGESHGDWVDAVSTSEEMGDTRKASEVFHSEQKRQKDGESDDGVRVDPVSIQRVEGGQDVEVSDGVESVLDELWNESDED